MAYIFNDYMNEYFVTAFKADPGTRAASRAQWTEAAKVAKDNYNFDSVIFAAEHIAAIDSADTIAEYVKNAIALFEAIPYGYKFTYPDNETEIFESYRAAAMFARYNLDNMGGVENE